jgi:hypothetical protein
MSSQRSPILRIDWANHNSAKFACERWHYSHCLPMGKLTKIGVWEDNLFVGVVIFSRGANHNIGRPYGLDQLTCCELTRVALKTHQTPVSRIVAIAIRFLRAHSPGTRLVISYADPEQGHSGGIYQAGGWIYAGLSSGSNKVFYKGKWVHQRTVDAKYGNHKGFAIKGVSGKHTYLMPLDSEMREHVEKLRKPYPKRAGSSASAASSVQGEEGGATPTPALRT